AELNAFGEHELVVIGTVAGPDQRAVAFRGGPYPHDLADANQSIAAIAGVEFLVARERRPDLEVHPTRESLRHLLHGIGRKVGSVDVHARKIAVHLRGLDASNQAEPGDESAQKQRNQNRQQQPELQQFLTALAAPVARQKPAEILQIQHSRAPMAHPHRVTEDTPAGRPPRISEEYTAIERGVLSRKKGT